MAAMGYVYLIRNGDLYKIGHTENLERRLKQLMPCELVQALKTDRSLNLEQELHRRFRDARIPQTEYFRLNAYQVEQVRLALGSQTVQESLGSKLTGWSKPPVPMHGPHPKPTNSPTRIKPAPAKQSEKVGDDWWKLERKKQGEIQAKEREAQKQRELEEELEAKRYANRAHWERMRQAKRENLDFE